jgi:hypothetical protein
MSEEKRDDLAAAIDEPIAPRTFIDFDDRVWQIEITIPDVARVKKLVDVNLLELVDVKGELFQRITGDVIFLCDLLYAICKPQADAANITDENFGRGLRGDALEKGLDALFLAVADFFPKERRRLMTSLHQRLNRFGQAAIEMAAEELNRATSDETMRRAISTAFGLGASASGSPESSASMRSGETSD